MLWVCGTQVAWAQSSPQAIIDAQAAEIARLRQEIETLKQNKPALETAEQAAEPSAAASTPADGHTAVLDTITVRNRRVTPLEKVKDTSQSISVVTGEELARFETTRFSDVLKKLGNVRAAGATGLVTGQNLSTRGIGFPGGSTQDPGIGVMVDGVSYAFTDMASSFNFYDLDTVEVLRGPQGTTGGLASNYGRVSFKTRAPSFTDEAEASVTVGQRKTLITKAILGGGIIDDLLAWRGTFYRETGDGPYINQYDITQSLYNKDRTSARLQFLLTPTKDFRARLSLEATPKGAESGSSSFGAFSRATPDYYDVYNAQGQRIKVDQTAEPAGRFARRWFTQDTSYRYLDADGTKDRLERSDAPPPERETKGATVELNWKPGENQYTSITDWRDYTFAWHGKNSGIRDTFDIMRAPSQAWTYYKQISQELKVASPIGGAVDYQAGLHYLETLTLSGKPGWGMRYGSDAGAYYATQAQYDQLDTDGSGRYLMANSVDRMNLATDSKIVGSKAAAYGNLNWHLDQAVTFNFGLRLSHERSQTTQSSSYLSSQGYAPELNPVSVNNVQLGGFASNADGSLTSNKNNAAQLALADAVALKYFGRSKYADPSDPNGANGLALTPAQRQQVAAAKAIRAGLIGSAYANTAAQPFSANLINASFSPSYKINDQHTAYVSWQHGEKPGVSQIVGATVNGGKSALTKAEKTNAYELGLKSAFFDQALVLNSSVFMQKIRNYIQSLYYLDEVQTAINNDGKNAYTLGLGNVPKITTKGIELDATYTLRRTTFRAAGAYTDPKYDDFPNSAKPPELRAPGAVAYQDVSGSTLAGASKLTYNLSVDQVIPVWGDKEFHAGANYNYVSAFNPSSTLSRYARQSGYGLADLALGLRTSNRKLDVTLIVRNLFNRDYGSMYDWNSYSPSEPRWIGVSISSKLL